MRSKLSKFLKSASICVLFTYGMRHCSFRMNLVFFPCLLKRKVLRSFGETADRAHLSNKLLMCVGKICLIQLSSFLNGLFDICGFEREILTYTIRYN